MLFGAPEVKKSYENIWSGAHDAQTSYENIWSGAHGAQQNSVRMLFGAHDVLGCPFCKIRCQFLKRRGPFSARGAPAHDAHFACVLI